jgi:hypothetical protein
MDSYLQNYVENAPNNAAATVALREGADAAAQKNITDLASNTEASLQNLAKYTSTPLSSAQVQQATSGISAGIATVTSGVPSELLAQSLQNRSATLEQNPNANLNTDSEYASSTNQQTVGYDAPTDWGDSA